MLEIICQYKFSLFKFLRGKYELNNKGKAVPLQAWRGPEGSRWFGLPDLKTICT
jgi:hypothetical protein